MVKPFDGVIKEIAFTWVCMDAVSMLFDLLDYLPNASSGQIELMPKVLTGRKML